MRLARRWERARSASESNTGRPHYASVLKSAAACPGLTPNSATTPARCNQGEGRDRHGDGREGGHQGAGQGEDPEAEHGRAGNAANLRTEPQNSYLAEYRNTHTWHAFLTFLAHGAHPRPHPRPRPRSRSRAFPRQVKKEISIMKLVRHDNIVFLKEVLASRTKVSLQGPFRSPPLALNQASSPPLHSH